MRPYKDLKYKILQSLKALEIEFYYTRWNWSKNKSGVFDISSPETAASGKIKWSQI